MGRPHNLLIPSPPPTTPAGRRLVGEKFPDSASAGEEGQLGEDLDPSWPPPNWEREEAQEGLSSSPNSASPCSVT